MAHNHPVSYRARYRQIAQVIARHGLGSLIGHVDLARVLPHRAGTQGTALPTPAQHLRLALEELGPTFIKLGQILSTRPDLLPPDYQAELAKLQDQAPPFPSAQALAVIAAEFGRPAEEVFASFDPLPLAAASIGQVHAATRTDGTEVVVKVQRPGVVEQVELDLQVLLNLAATADRRWSWAPQYDPVGLVQEFAQTLRAELDYVREAHNAARFAASFATDPAVHIPRVFWDTTTGRVLTLERTRGIKIDDLVGLEAAGIERPALARRAVRILLQMIFQDRFFHADPHPGNFFIEPGGRIALIDFGMVGTIDEPLQERLVQVLFALLNRDSDALVDTLLTMGIARGLTDRPHLKRDLDHMMTRYYDAALAEIDVARLLEEIFGIVRTHRLVLPANLVLLGKVLVMNEGLGARLDPTFSLTTELAPYVRRFAASQQAPARWVRRFGKAGADWALFGIDLPQHLRRILLELEHGGLEVRIRTDDLEPVVRRFERLANRITLGVMTASFIIGLAILLAMYRPAEVQGWASALFAFGFVAAVVLGLYLAWSILRSGRA